MINNDKHSTSPNIANTKKKKLKKVVKLGTPSILLTFYLLIYVLCGFP